MEVRFFRYDDAERILHPCARVDDFTSLIFTRSYSGIGKWQMTIPLESENAGLLMEADILHLRHGVSGLVTKYTKSVEDGNETLTVTGIELKGLVCGRIVLPPAGQAYVTYRNTDPAAVIGYLLSDHLLNADENRIVPGNILWPKTGQRIAYSGRFSSLEEDIQGICEEFSIGYYATVNSERRIAWYVYTGTDHRRTQTEHTKMIWTRRESGTTGVSQVLRRRDPRSDRRHGDLRKGAGVIGVPVKNGDRTVCLYWVKCCDEPSAFGIDGGRIVKLAIMIDGKTVCHYERGWDIEPEGYAAEFAYQILIKEYN